MLIEELILLLETETEDLKKEIQKLAAKATSMPISVRAGKANELYIVIDSGVRGKQGGDEHELTGIMKKIEDELGADHPTERLYDEPAKRKGVELEEKLVGLQVFAKRKDGERYPLLKVKFIKKSIPRPTAEGDPKKEYVKYKIETRKGHGGENNELHFVSLLDEKIKEAGGMIKELEFDGYTNDQKLTLINVMSVRRVGQQNGKADVLFFDDVGTMTRISLKQRNFMEIHAGETFFHANEEAINGYIDQAVDTAQVELDEEGKFSKKKHFEIAARLSKSEAKDAYFGKDKEQVEAVIIETFLAKDFKLIGTKLTVKCDYVLKMIDDVHDRLWPYLAINSDFEKGVQQARAVRGRTFISIVPRFRLKTHARKSTKYPKTLIIGR